MNSPDDRHLIFPLLPRCSGFFRVAAISRRTGGLFGVTRRRRVDREGKRSFSCKLVNSHWSRRTVELLDDRRERVSRSKGFLHALDELASSLLNISRNGIEEFPRIYDLFDTMFNADHPSISGSWTGMKLFGCFSLHRREAKSYPEALPFPLNEPRKWRKPMAMLSLDYSRQFSITMYLRISCWLRGHSPVIKDIAGLDLLPGCLREFLRRPLSG